MRSRGNQTVGQSWLRQGRLTAMLALILAWPLGGAG
jgi:hypothetical protein